MERAHDPQQQAAPAPVISSTAVGSAPFAPVPLSTRAGVRRALQPVRAPRPGGAPQQGRAPQQGSASEMSVMGVGARAAEKRFDLGKAGADLATFEARVARLGLVDASQVLAGVRGFVEAAERGQQHEVLLARGSLRKGLAALNPAFRRPDDPAGGGDQEAMDRSRNANGVVLWSKLNKFRAAERATAEGNVSLESSAGGALFDGLTFGIHRSDPYSALQWTEVSKAFVNASALLGTSEGAAAEVHSLVFRGIDERSVFSRTEWPVLRSRLREGGCLVVHVFDLADGDNHDLVETAVHHIRNEREWNELRRVAPNAASAKLQSRAHQGELAANAPRVAAALAARESTLR